MTALQIIGLAIGVVIVGGIIIIGLGALVLGKRADELSERTWREMHE